MKIIWASLLLTANISCTTTLPLTATAERIGSAKGKACLSNLLGIIPLSTDASVYKAARAGGVKKIATVDVEHFFTVIYNRRCTVVRGKR